MKNKRSRFLTPADAAIVVSLLALAAALLLLPGKETGKAEVIKDGELLYGIDLSDVKESYILEPDDGVKILVGHGEISFADSDCPNRLCVNTGKLTRAGDTAVCLPHKILIRITGKTPLDAVTG